MRLRAVLITRRRVSLLYMGVDRVCYRTWARHFDPLQSVNAKLELVESPRRGVFQRLDLKEEDRGRGVETVGHGEHYMAVAKRATVQVEDREDGGGRRHTLDEMAFLV